MGLLPLNYRRPQLVVKEDKRPASSSTAETGTTLGDDVKAGASIKSGQSGQSAGIPPALSFDKIMDGGTCPPCTIRDFMNYLIYIERAAENLQFFLWYRDYSARFAAAPATDRALAPEWTQGKAEEVAQRLQREHTEKMRREPQAAKGLFKGTYFEKQGRVDEGSKKGSDWGTPNPGADAQSTTSASNASSYKAQAKDAFGHAGAKQPFTIQPFREEVERVVATYVAEDAPRQLNLSSRERAALLQALAATTHPSAFAGVARTVEWSLRRQAHPNFIRWSICNGNPARVAFARGLGASLVAAGLAVGVVLALSRAPRGWRAMAAIALVLGVSTLVAAYKGMCVVLHGLHHRHVRPWELFETEDRDVEEEGGEGESGGGGNNNNNNNNNNGSSKLSFDSLGSSNCYEDEPWVVRYEKRNIVRKVFDREVWIQEPALRQIQDTIFVQALLAAVLVAAVLTAIFVAVPGGDFF
ncbi:hypothetical protein RB597_009203 [Gaeumannomyces tritici]